MRRFVTVIMLLAGYTTLLAQTGWISHTDLTTRTLRGCFAMYLPVSDDRQETLERYVIVGDSGTVITHTVNGEWYVQSIDSTTNLTSVTYFNTDTLFAVGDSGKVYRSNDSGNTWSLITAIGGRNIRYLIMFPDPPMFNPKMIWGCGDSGLYIRSVNRGYTFSKITTSRHENLNYIYPINIVDQYVFGDSCIMRSTNGGRLFENLYLPSVAEHENFYSGYFSSASDGICFGTHGTILTTTTYGAVWIPRTSGVDVTLRASCFFASGVGYVVGDSGVILKTRDGGATWKQLISGTTKNLYGVAFLNEKEGIFVGEDGTLLETVNGAESNPMLVTYTDFINLGFVPMGSSKQFTIPLYNKGPDKFTVSSISFPNGDFASTSSQCTLQTGDKGKFLVTYTPSSEGMLYGDIHLYHNGVDSQYNVQTLVQSEKASQPSAWLWQNPVIPESNIRDICFVDDSTLVAVGVQGQFLKSRNRGISWSSYSSIGGTKNELKKIWFANSDTGYAAGVGGTILKTTNGGKHWAPIESGSGAKLFDICYPGPERGFALGYYDDAEYFRISSSILTTTNSGDSWDEEFLSRYGVSSIYFVDADTGLLIKGNLMRTTNGGATWYDIDPGVPVTSGVLTFASNDTGFIAGAKGLLLKTVNAGREWVALNSGTTAALYSIAFQNSLEGIAVGEGGIVLHTTDGGVTWVSSVLNASYSLMKCALRNNIGYVYGIDYSRLSYKLFRSTDTGKTWANVNSNSITSKLLNDVEMMNQDVTIAVGDSGMIVRSEDAGVTWTRPLSGSVLELAGVSLKGISTVDQNVGFVVGSYGTILRTTNAGVSWIVIQSITTSDLNDVSCSSPYICYAVGSNGIIMKTTDGGTTWLGLGGITSQNLNAIHTSGENTFSLVGANGFFGRTTDDGKNWTVNAFTQGLPLNDVYFVDENKGIVIGDVGRIYRTTDGGHLWALIPSGTTLDLHSIYFANDLVGFITGDNGVVLFTVDGGQSWSMAGNHYYPHLMAISGSDSYHLTAVGASGTIIRTNTGGFLSVPASSPTVRPERFTLDQNYPNPFNPVTAIRFSIPETRVVTLKVYDLLGREVARLVDERLAPGTYTVSWDANNVTSGVYFYRLTAGDYSEVKKMLLVR